jgi:hypothetical protein
MHCGWTGLKPPEVVVDGSDDDEFMVGANTLTTEDTLTEVPDNERICLLEAGVMGHGIKPCLANAKFSSDLPQLASVALATYNAGLRVIRHHQPDDISPMMLNGGGICLYDHIWGHGRHT